MLFLPNGKDLGRKYIITKKFLQPLLKCHFHRKTQWSQTPQKDVYLLRLHFWADNYNSTVSVGGIYTSPNFSNLSKYHYLTTQGIWKKFWNNAWGINIPNTYTAGGGRKNLLHFFVLKKRKWKFHTMMDDWYFSSTKERSKLISSSQGSLLDIAI